MTMRSEIRSYRYGRNRRELVDYKCDIPTDCFNHCIIKPMKKSIITVLYKNIFAILGGLFVLATFAPSIVLGQFGDEPFPYDIQGQDYNPNAEPTTTDGVVTTNVASDLIQPDTQESVSLLTRLSNIFRLRGTSFDNPNSTSKATDYIKRILNILLGLVSLLSLVMTIYAFYLIFFSKGEDGVTKAKKILIGVAIALAIM